MLFDAAMREIEDFGSWTRGEKLTWSNLAARLGVSRQALESRSADERKFLAEAFWKQKESLRRTDDGTNPVKIIRRTFQQRLDAAKSEAAELQKRLDGWIEKWVTVEYNCRRIGVNADEILSPLAKPDRQSR